MIAAMALLLQVAGGAPAAVVVRAGAHAATLPIVTTNQTPSIAAKKLTTALGGTWRSSGSGHYTMLLGDAHIELTDGVPFARVDSAVVPLASAPTLVDGTLYVPFQLAADIIPRLVTGYIYDASADEIRAFTPVVRTVAAPPRANASSAAPSAAVAQLPDPAPAADVDEPADNNTDPGAASSLDPSPDPSSVALHHHHTVIVDAGHGGVDHGMTGPIRGGPKIYEKNITLAIAKLVAADLRERGIHVIMTRTTDTLINLYDRGRIANRSHGDVFVSIHVNATGSRGPDGIHERGYETYFLAEAKTEEAGRVERMENEAVRFETGASARKGDPLKDIMTDMAQNEHLRESDDLAQTIQSGFRSFHPGPDRGVQQANFAVLRGSYMPAVLVETGFGTNPSEATFLSDPAQQRIIARSITRSIVKYLAHYEARVAAQSSTSKAADR